jgi:asparagine synthase (glutamine-hydrolysing)
MIPVQRLRRLLKATEAALRSQRGDVLEFGVASGGSAVLLARTARRYRSRFAGFDVFGMPPAPTEKDGSTAADRHEVILAGKAEGVGGDVYYGYKTDLLQTVSETFDRYGLPVDGQNVTLLKGLFEETWPSFASKPVAMAHIDISWHDPVKYSLDVVAPLLTRSGRIVVNTYRDAGGSRDAVDQFLAAHRDFVMEDGDTPILRRRT